MRAGGALLTGGPAVESAADEMWFPANKLATARAFPPPTAFSRSGDGWLRSRFGQEGKPPQHRRELKAAIPTSCPPSGLPSRGAEGGEHSRDGAALGP